MTTQVDQYFLVGCGRCSLGGTPDCKVHSWTTELALLRSLVLETELREEVKWGVPCYTYEQKNVLLLSAFKEYCTISFFKGVLLDDPENLLQKPGPNSQASRVLRFTSIAEIEPVIDEVKALVQGAIAVEMVGREVVFNKNPEPIPEELKQRFKEDPPLKNAFESLTPGRQRGYILYFSSPKQSKTRVARIEKSVGKILRGEGLHDKYQRRR
ncbi:MAG: YdeI/OmpD-associated family protein [Bacteroidota bacterium]